MRRRDVSLTRASGFNLRSVRQVSPENIPTLNCSVSKSSTYLPSSRFKNAAMAPSNIVPHLTVSTALFTYRAQCDTGFCRGLFS